jgi:hypothetical protein
MAGERYAKITIRAGWSYVDSTRGDQTTQVKFRLGGVWETYNRGGSATEYAIPDPSNITPDPRQFVMQGVTNLVALLKNTIQQRGLPYTVSALRDAGDDSSHIGQGGFGNAETAPWPLVEFDITATVYDTSYNLDFSTIAPTGWQIVQNITTIPPVYVSALVTDAIIYKSATGSIELLPSNGLTGYYTYQWADPGAPATAVRTNVIGPADYTCLVMDASGASATIVVHVGSDPRLDVFVQKVANDVTLITTGGVAPYTYAWADGPTTDVRLGLAGGTYKCTVTDSHGATVTITVTIEFYNRFYFSRNPVVLELAALDLATKPNLRFLCEVWLEVEYLSGVFISIAGELTQPADSEGRTTFDVSTLLDAYVQPDFPAYGESGIKQATKCFKRFYLQHSEQWDGSPVPTFSVRETHYLVYGGLDFYEYASDAYFSVYRPQVHPFLTWEPVQKDVLPDQPEYLYYHHDSLKDKAFTVQVTFINSSGTRTPVQLGTASGVECFSVWRLGVGLPQLRAALLNSIPDDVVAWEVVVLTAAGTAASETRYYQLSEELPGLRRYFLYANSVAGINTLAAVGKAKTEITFSNVLVQRSLRPKYDPDQGEGFVTNVAGLPILTANTGYLTPAQMEAFQDFLLSEEVRYFDTDRYRPGSLQPLDALPVADDDTGLLSVEFAFVQPTKRRFTPTLPLQ